MRHTVLVVLALLIAACLAGCSGAVAPAPQPATPPAPQRKTLPPPPPTLLTPEIWHTAAEVHASCKAHISAAQAVRDYLKAVEGPRTAQNTLAPMSDMLVELDRVLPLSDLVANVHPDKAVREAAEKCQQDAMKFYSDLKLDRGLFDALFAVPADGLDPMAGRSLDHLLRDYRRAGVDKDETTRKELARLNEELVKTGQDFSRTIREDKREIALSGAADLAGLPRDFVDSHKPGADGKIRVSTDYPDFFPFATYSTSEELRKELYLRFLSRGHPANDEALKKLLTLRHAYAVMLGYPDWAEYNAEDKMVGHEKVIAEFIDKVADIGRPRMKADLSDLSARKARDAADAKKARKGAAPAAIVTDPAVIHVWDRFYYVEKVRSERFGVDSQKVREYFAFEKVRDGLLALNQDLFGVVFKKVDKPDAWDPSVEAYDVMDGAEILGRVYMDMHPRNGKYNHAAMFPMNTGVDGRQLPSGAMVCNFPDPKLTGGRALMEHNDVVTFFHEFGHLMHHMLSGKQRWYNLAGLSCEWDFAEAPSQIMEEWAWNADVLRRFATNATGEPIPKDLVTRMRAADEFGKGVHTMRQIFYAALSLAYHSRDPKDMDLMGVVKELQQKYSPYPLEAGTWEYDNFGHLDGYSSMYYTYMWSLVLSKDLFTRFEQKGLLDKPTALEYRADVLAPGGSVDAAAMVEKFLGRPYTFDAFKAWLEKSPEIPK
ncbi:MAG: Zn-dependent oligopeptidase [Deltaproteobacteria bacterium]|nr:Zn-dependent oligopeptidase [Deltaproteobacteria bacterium]